MRECNRDIENGNNCKIYPSQIYYNIWISSFSYLWEFIIKHHRNIRTSPIIFLKIETMKKIRDPLYIIVFEHIVLSPTTRDQYLSRKRYFLLVLSSTTRDQRLSRNRYFCSRVSRHQRPAPLDKTIFFVISVSRHQRPAPLEEKKGYFVIVPSPANRDQHLSR